VEPPEEIACFVIRSVARALLPAAPAIVPALGVLAPCGVVNVARFNRITSKPVGSGNSCPAQAPAGLPARRAGVPAPRYH